MSVIVCIHNLETPSQFQLDLTDNFSFQRHWTANFKKLVAGPVEDPKQSLLRENGFFSHYFIWREWKLIL